jgi:class 3 adenylate cyclase/predicted ATPase
MTALSEWLRRAGLEAYEGAFAESGVDLDVIPDLGEADLKEIGLSLGDRKRFLRAAAALRPAPMTGSGKPEQHVTPVAPARTAVPSSAAERRQLTVMLCDLVGSTALSAQLDPEDMRELIGLYHVAVTEAVTRFNGFVAKYMGDGVLVYFGYPQAHEGDPEQALRAGLAVVDAVARLTTVRRVQVRVGIATGLVVVGDFIGSGSSQEQAVVGEIPNIAARLQSIAKPDTVVVSGSTRELVWSLFEFADLGPQELKGIAGPQRVWQVLRETTIDIRFNASRSEETPFIGRAEELEILVRRWQQAKSGKGRVVLLSGEPGIGKSRLLLALMQAINSDRHFPIRYYCSPYHTSSALHPVIARLERSAGIQNNDTGEQRFAKLSSVLAPSHPSPQELAVIADLLSIPRISAVSEVEVSPKKRKEATLTALGRQLDALSQRRPVLMVWEDVQWIDPTSLELLSSIVERAHALPVLVVLTCRPEFTAPWTALAHSTIVHLNRLDPQNVADLVNTIAKERAMPPGLVQQIVARADGIPLFIEELTKTLIEDNVARERLAVPSSLQAALLSRLDRLGPAREIGQIGAAIGREFSYDLIATVAATPASELRSALTELEQAGLLHSRGELPWRTYVFKHALVQDAAYATLLRGRRQELHERIARAIERDHPEISQRQPEVIARHYTEAGQTDAAAAHWLRAGKRSAELSANSEAVEHLTRGLDILKSLPDTTQRQNRELEYLLALGPCLISITGGGAAAVGDAYVRARELARQVGSLDQKFTVTWNLWFVHEQRGELATSRDYANDSLAIAHEIGEPKALLQAHHAAWTTLFNLPQLTDCREHIRNGRALYDPAAHHSQAFAFADHDPGVCCGCHDATALWMLGYPDQALASVTEAVELASHLKHQPSLMIALAFACFVHESRGDFHQTESCATRLAEIGMQTRWSSVAGIMTASVRALATQDRTAAGEMRAHIDQLRASGTKLRMPYYLGLLVDIHRRFGDVNDGLATVDEAFAEMSRTGERRWESELHRQRGELLILSNANDTAPAETSIQKALHVARQQEAKSLELRAAASLGRLYRAQGHHTKARDLVVPIYSWFSEGFETADLKEVAALLLEAENRS